MKNFHYLCYNGIDDKLGVNMKKVLFIASTGGHLDELMQLKSMFNDYDYHLITEKTKSTLSLKDIYPKRVNYLVYGTYTTFLNRIIYPFKLIYNTFKSLVLYIKIRPKYIVTTGTHTSSRSTRTPSATATCTPRSSRAQGSWTPRTATAQATSRP